ncbi:hypothetical protein ES703_55259 [subsurface metagenome]
MEKNRRCDARCHNAKGTRCRCWCNGRYHGLGHKKAIQLLDQDFYWLKMVKSECLLSLKTSEHVSFFK